MNGDRLREIGMERGEETAEKDAAYASGYQVAGRCMALFFPRGIPAGAENMTRAGLLFRTLDKLCREAHLIETGAPDAFGENPWADCCGYAILGTALSEAREQTGAPTEAPIPLRHCEYSEDCGLDEGHGGDCVQRDGARIHRHRRSGIAPGCIRTSGCVRTPGHLEECLIDGKEKTSA